MNDTEDLLVTSIDEMIVRAARRLVEQRQTDAGGPESERRAGGSQQQRLRDVVERLVKLRHAMLSERPPGSATLAGLPAQIRAAKKPGQRAPSRGAPRMPSAPNPAIG